MAVASPPAQGKAQHVRGQHMLAQRLWTARQILKLDGGSGLGKLPRLTQSKKDNHFLIFSGGIVA